MGSSTFSKRNNISGKNSQAILRIPDNILRIPDSSVIISSKNGKITGKVLLKNGSKAIQAIAWIPVLHGPAESKPQFLFVFGRWYKRIKGTPGPWTYQPGPTPSKKTIKRLGTEKSCPAPSKKRLGDGKSKKAVWIKVIKKLGGGGSGDVFKIKKQGCS